MKYNGHATCLAQKLLICKYLTYPMTSRTKELEKMFEGFHSLKMNLAAGRRELPAGMRITGSQWLVLGLIARKGSASVKDISAALDMTSSAATQIVNELVKSANVVKHSDPKDARVTRVALSAKAKRDMATLRTTMLRHMTKLYSVLSDREFKTYLTLNQKVIDACEVQKH